MYVDERCGWRSQYDVKDGGELLYVGFDNDRIPLDKQNVAHGQGVCPRCFLPFRGAFHPSLWAPMMGSTDT